MIKTPYIFNVSIPALIFYTEDATLLAGDLAYLFPCKHTVLVTTFRNITGKLIYNCRTHPHLYLAPSDPCQLFFAEHTSIFILSHNNGISCTPLPPNAYTLLPVTYRQLDETQYIQYNNPLIPNPPMLA